eukprot:TRINITY_DN8551_c0_g2_i1.p1 TRINITY_DN8551_c0_g2~~TRINITY_DN8551_c0_g2_i1.p1  ORF type:complete len:107 (-),score=3.50 TRINITY_DN8551_c0_g2_i1:267-587(-)
MHARKVCMSMHTALPNFFLKKHGCGNEYTGCPELFSATLHSEIAPLSFSFHCPGLASRQTDNVEVFMTTKKHRSQNRCLAFQSSYQIGEFVNGRHHSMSYHVKDET